MNILEKLIFTNNDKDNEQLGALKKSKLPVVVWGKGDLANNVIRLLQDEGINVEYIYININSSNEKTINGVTVINNLNVFDTKINLVMGHSRYEYASDIKEKNSIIEEVYMFSNPFSSHDRITSSAFVNENIDRFQEIFDLLEDDLSRNNLVAYINSRCNKDVDYICSYDNNYFNNSVFSISNEESYVDIGAYDGDTIRLFLGEADGKYKDIFAIEPEPNAYKKLQNYLYTNNITAKSYNMGCYNSRTELIFDNSKDTSSRIINSGDGIRIPVDELDNILYDKRISLLKIAQQGPVKAILEGAKNILFEQKPKLAVVVGLDVYHLLDIPNVIKKIKPEYKIYLRFLGKLPSRLTMFAI